jgi:hypothetical protein
MTRIDSFFKQLRGHTPAFSRREVPELCRNIRPEKQGRRECRTLGASAAACAVVECTRVSHHGHTGNARHSPRNGFNGFLRALPGDRAFLPPSPLRSLLPKGLMPASGHQNHATSPSARGALVFGAARVHRIPHPTFVTIAKRPSDRGGTVESIMLILANGEAKYFSSRGWTRKSRNRLSGKSRLASRSSSQGGASANGLRICGRIFQQYRTEPVHSDA